MLSLGHLLFHKKAGAFLMVLCKYGKGTQSLTYDQTFKKGSKIIRGWIISIRNVNGYLTLQKMCKINLPNPNLMVWSYSQIKVWALYYESEIKKMIIFNKVSLSKSFFPHDQSKPKWTVKKLNFVRVLLFKSLFDQNRAMQEGILEGLNPFWHWNALSMTTTCSGIAQSGQI